MASDAIGAILAGGRSSRMGRPKAVAELGGRPLISHPLAAVVDAGLEAVVVAEPDTELPDLGCEVLLEPEEPHHPLLGIVTALRASAGRPVIVVACDMPFVPASLLAALAVREGRLVVCEGGGRLHPLLGRYEPGLAPALEAAIERDQSAREAVLALEPAILGTAELSNFGPPERFLMNVNDQHDLSAAEKLVSG